MTSISSDKKDAFRAKVLPRTNSVLPDAAEINRRLSKKLCLYCGCKIPNKENYQGRYNPRFCKDSHRVMYNCKLKEEEINRMTPEEFIKQQLKKPVEPRKRKVKQLKALKRIYYRGRIFTFDTMSSYFRTMGLEDGDLLEFTIKLKKKKYNLLSPK